VRGSRFTVMRLHDIVTENIRQDYPATDFTISIVSSDAAFMTVPIFSDCPADN